MKEKNILIKIFLCSIYLIMITILVVCFIHMYEQKTVYFSENKSYSYIEVSKMSEQFAYDKKTNTGFHFVIDTEDKTYIIAIKEKDYNKYKNIIDYSYNKIEKQPDTIKIYGYPIVTNKKLNKLANDNIEKFSNNKIQNEKYYLDSTTKKNNNIIVKIFIIVATLLLIVLFFLTLFDKGKKTTN